MTGIDNRVKNKIVKYFHEVGKSKNQNQSLKK